MCVGISVPPGFAAEDCNHNGLDDGAELADGDRSDCNWNGLPDDCDIALDAFGFTSAVGVDLGYFARALELGDMNGDGRLDMVVLREEGIQVLPGKEGIRFDPNQSPSVGLPTRFSAAALVLLDANGDGRLDALGGVGGLHTLEGDGQGGLRLVKVGSVQVSASEFTFAADMDLDGDEDLVVHSFGWINVLLNDGNGAFEGAYDARFCETSRPCEIADIDGDDTLDIAAYASDENRIHILWNQGDGRTYIEAALPRPLPPDVSRIDGQVVALDTDHDGDLDLLHATEAGDDSMILQNVGRHRFALTSSLPPFKNAYALIVEDFDTDGLSDLLSAPTFSGANPLSLHRGTLNGLSARALPIALRAERLASPYLQMSSLRSGDLDSDGDIDVVFSSWPDWDTDHPSGRSQALVLLNRGTADCNSNGVVDACEPDCDLSGWPDDCDVQLGGAPDCDADLRPDVCTTRDANANLVPDACELAAGEAFDCNGNGWPDDAESRLQLAFEVGWVLPRGYFWPAYHDFIQGDWNGDADPDIAVLLGDREVHFLLNRGNGTFRDVRHDIPHEALHGLCAADWNEDGVVDFSVISSAGEEWRVDTLLNFGGCEVGLAGHVLASETAIEALRGLDLDGDGHADLLASRTGGGLWLAPGRGDGLFRSARQLAGLAPGPGWSAIHALDADLDGDLDLATPGGSLHINDGAAAFVAGAFPVSPKARSLAVADIDRNGAPDLITGLIALNPGQGAFVEWQFLLDPVEQVDAGDVDGDQDMDLHFGGVQPAILNRGDGTFPTESKSLRSVAGPITALADFDGDEFADLLYNVESFDAHNLGVQRSRGDGTFRDTPLLDPAGPPGKPREWFFADLDGDARLDGYAVDGDSPTLAWNDGTGKFVLSPLPPVSSPVTLVGADLDQDGAVDVIVGQGAGCTILWSDGRHSYSSRSEFPWRDPVQPDRGVRVWPVDLDADSDLDLFADAYTPTWQTRVLPFLNDGNRAFHEGPAEPIRDSLLIRLLDGGLVGDWNNDGKTEYADVVQHIDDCRGDYCLVDWALDVYLDDGGSFVRSQRLNLEQSSLDPAAGDPDEDGDLDLMVPLTDYYDYDGGHYPGQDLSIYQNDGRGLFSFWGAIPTGSQPRSPVVGDIDGDGLPDIVLSFVDESSRALLLNRSRLPKIPPGGGHAVFCSAYFRRGDWNQDGQADLSDAIALLSSLFLGGAATSCAAAGDVDSDGKLNLTDPVRLLLHLFQGAPPPEEPWTACGLGGRPSQLECERHAPCE